MGPGGFGGGATLISGEHSRPAQPPWLRRLSGADSQPTNAPFLYANVLARYPSWNTAKRRLICLPADDGHPRFKLKTVFLLSSLRTYSSLESGDECTSGTSVIRKHLRLVRFLCENPYSSKYKFVRFKLNPSQLKDICLQIRFARCKLR